MAGCTDWVRSAHCAIYTSFLLSSWGDRMWSFAVGLYLVYFDGGVLLLAAVYGVIMCLCILLLGGIIGRWVDNNPRLRVVTLSLVIQNVSVALCAVAVCVLLRVQHHSWLRPLLITLIMLLALLARLTSTAYKIAIEKDWIVVVSGGEPEQLAKLNAVTRVIDLCSKCIAPTAVGAVMTYGSLLMGAIVIAVWNVISVFLEFALLRRVYSLVPRLAYKGGNIYNPKSKSLDKAAPEEMSDIKATRGESTELKPADKDSEAHSSGSKSKSDAETKPVESEPLTNGSAPEEAEAGGGSQEKTCVQLMFTPCTNLVQGWRVYARQAVVFAGISLSCLYMTVLGFDSITVGYVYSQGVSESLLGVASGLAGLTGIIGAFIFTRLHARFGLPSTGLISFLVEILCLVLAVVSIWTPGSPFIYYHGSSAHSNCTDIAALNNTTPLPPALNTTIPTRAKRSWQDSWSHLSLDLQAPHHMSGLGYEHKEPSFYENMFPVFNKDSDSFSVMPVTGVNKRIKRSAPSPTDEEEENSICPKRAYTSALLFLIGIVTSRIGLWMADLTVTQTLQEYVTEAERGVVSGVQASLNEFMNLLKFVMVLGAPRNETFGILAMISFGFICIGGLFFLYHVVRKVDRRTLSEQDCDEKTEKDGDEKTEEAVTV